MSKETVLEEAARITGGDRNASYGDPNQDFKRTADMWTGLFQDKLKPGERFEPQDVAMAMILIKCSRQIHQKKRDNWTDIAGYAFCGNRCDEADSPQAGGAGDYTDQGGSEPASESDPGDGRQGNDSGELKEGDVVYAVLRKNICNA